MPLQELQGFLAGGGLKDLAVVKAQRVIKADYDIVGNCEFLLWHLKNLLFL
jgi:hypothetical protein